MFPGLVNLSIGTGGENGNKRDREDPSDSPLVRFRFFLKGTMTSQEESLLKIHMMAKFKDYLKNNKDHRMRDLNGNVTLDVSITPNTTLSADYRTPISEVRFALTGTDAAYFIDHTEDVNEAYAVPGEEWKHYRKFIQDIFGVAPILEGPFSEAMQDDKESFVLIRYDELNESNDPLGLFRYESDIDAFFDKKELKNTRSGINRLYSQIAFDAWEHWKML